MTSIREEPRNANAATTTGTTAGDTPQVEVYDNDKPSTTRIMQDEERTHPANSTYGTSTRASVPQPRSGTNWGSIILGILVILALIALIMWIF